MIIYFDIDQPIITGDAYFKVRFFSMPGDTVFGEEVIVSDNLQHFIDLPFGDYRMNIVYYNGISFYEDEYNILIDENGDIIYGEDNEILYEPVERPCDEKDIYFTVSDYDPPDPPDPPEPCECSTFSVTYFPCSKPPYLVVSFLAQNDNNCGYEIHYRPTPNQSWSVTDVTSSQLSGGFDILLPTASQDITPDVRIMASCCDGSDIICFDNNVTVDSGDCDCDVAVFSASIVSAVGQGGGFLVTLNINVSGGEEPMILTINETNAATPQEPTVIPVQNGVNTVEFMAATSSAGNRLAFSLFINNECGVSQIIYVAQ